MADTSWENEHWRVVEWTRDYTPELYECTHCGFRTRYPLQMITHNIYPCKGKDALDKLRRLV